MSEWIKCSERLPEYSTPEWLFCMFNYPGVENTPRLAHWNPLRKKLECAYKSKVIEDFVTHWMPLPNPPTEEK
jgi:hypothetical protein